MNLARYKSRLGRTAQLLTVMVGACVGMAAERSVDFGMAVWRFGDGLPQNFVRAITQTRDGFLWVATDNAVSRFNGVDFSVYDASALHLRPGSGIGAILASRDGSLWVGAAGGRLLRHEAGKFVDFTARLGLDHENHILSLCEDSAGCLWIGAREGVFRFKNGQFSKYDDLPILSKASVRRILEDPPGTYWFCASFGLICLTNEQQVVYSETNTLNTPFVRAFCRANSGELWVGTDRGVVRRGAGKPACYTRKEGLPDNYIRSLYADRHGGIWAGSYGGLGFFSKDRFIPILNDSGDPFDMVTSFFEDNEGNLWIGAKDGLFRVNRNTFRTYTTREGLAHNNVMSVCEAPGAGMLLGTWGGGLSRFSDGKFSSAVKGSMSDKILGLCIGRDGGWWAGADFDGGVYHVRSNRVAHYGPGKGITNAIRTIIEDRRGTIWIGGNSGLFRLQGKTLERFAGSDAFPGPVVRSLFEDRQGAIWVGTSQGLSRLSNGRMESFTSQNGFCDGIVLALYEDDAGTMWIGTGGNGLFRLKNGKFSKYSTQEGLFSNAIHEILEDESRNFWISCRHGVFRVSRSQFEEIDAGRRTRLNCVSYNRADGLVTVECNAVAKPSACKSSDGRLWFATAKGLSVADPRLESEQNNVVAPIVIERILADKRAVATPGPNTNESQAVVIPPGIGELEFQFAALSYRLPDRNQFKYKLEPLESDWVESGHRRFAIYNNLVPGDYRFRVIGCNNDGVWNDTGASIAVTLEPRFWQTRWFFGLNVLLVVGTTAGVARYVSVRKLRGRLEQLERERAIEKERVRIARDMHDDLGARVTEILLLADKARKSGNPTMGLEAITQAADEMAHNLDALVWAVNPRHDSLDTMVLYLTEYAVKFLGRIEVGCRLDVPDEIAPRPISSEVRHSTFLVVKEALNNIAKYAGATEVWLRIAVQQDAVAISIEDNGKGFAVSDTRAFGNGLINMRKRMEAVHGCFDLSSDPGKGTRIHLRIPLPDSEGAEHRPLRN